jgi:hypothetical protein
MKLAGESQNVEEINDSQDHGNHDREFEAVHFQKRPGPRDVGNSLGPPRKTSMIFSRSRR